jgi:glycosyltransferase involved in cell wall biosynthesis
MTLISHRPLSAVWLVPDDHGGGIITVAEECCRQAARAGHSVTLLLLLPSTSGTGEFGGFRIESLNAKYPYSFAPVQILDWLAKQPQDVIFVNGCEQADFAIPYVPAGTRVLYVVHDTADCYFKAALRHEACIDSIIAVSETVAVRFRNKLKDRRKLHVIHNGTGFPRPTADILATARGDDLIFLGGDNPAKGAHDVLTLWVALNTLGFSGFLHWFGNVSETFLANISSLPCAERIFVHGRRRRQAIFDVATRSKVLLMLSRAEPFGMVTVECMGMGCLPVAWDIATGTKEIVAQGEGAFVRLGDYQALAGAVLDILALHRSRFVASTFRIRKEFSEAAMWARYEMTLGSLFGADPAYRQYAGKIPPPYRPPLRLYQWLPAGLRSTIRGVLGRSPRINYAFRDFRGR